MENKILFKKAETIINNEVAFITEKCDKCNMLHSWDPRAGSRPMCGWRELWKELFGDS
jgi:hypothetical protein